MRYNRLTTILILSLLFLSMTAVTYASARTIETEELIFAKKDPRYNFDSTIDVSNKSDKKFSNYNVTWKPVLQDFNLTGIVSTTPVPPNIVSLNRSIPSDTWVHAGMPVEFSYGKIMNGASQTTWRSPFSDHKGNYSLRLRIFRTSTAEMSNMSIEDTPPELPGMNEKSNPSLVYDSHIMEVNQTNNHRYFRHTEEIPSGLTDKDVQYNSTYVNATAPIYPDETYYPIFSFKGETEPDLLYNQMDISDNGRKSHIGFSNATHTNKSTNPADLQMDVLMRAGLSAHVSGVEFSHGFDNSSIENPSIEFTTPFEGWSFYSDEYLTFNMPFFYSNDENFSANITFEYLEGTTKLGTSYLDYDNYNDFILVTLNHTEVKENVTTVSDINRIRVNITDTKNKMNTDKVNFWLYDFNNNYSSNYLKTSSDLDFKVNGHQKTVQMGFQPFHSMQQTGGEWQLIRPLDFYTFKVEKSFEGTHKTTWTERLNIVYEKTQESVVAAYNDVASVTPLPNSKELVEGAIYISNQVWDALQKFGDFIYGIGVQIYEWITEFIDAFVFYGKALLNLAIFGISIGMYLMFTVVTTKACLGMVILARDGVDPMLEYYTKFMDNIITLTKEAEDLLPVI